MLKSQAQFALMFSLEELFCSVDDFCQGFEGQWKQQLLRSGLQLRNRPRGLSPSEIMTISIAFHQSSCRNFKTYYQEKVPAEWAPAFPGLVSYQRFIDWVPGTLVPMCAYLRLCFGKCSGISCYGLDITQSHTQPPHWATPRSIGSLASSCIWWSMTEANCGGIMQTPGNTDDRTPVPKLLQQLFGKVFADKGYVSQKLAKQLLHTAGIQLITKQRAQHETAIDALE